MEVKPRYKKTEVGVIPEDWGVHTIGDLKPFVTSGSRGWASYYSERGDLFVRIANLTRKSIHLDLTNCRFVQLPEDDNEGIRTQLKENDVLISITADIGIIGYIDARVPAPAHINQHIALLRFDPAKVNSKFVSYFLASEESQKKFRAATDTGAKAGMSLNAVQKIRTALPPTTDEQRAIATALSDVDALLDGLTRLIAKKCDLKQAAMQQLLTGQTRLPGFSGAWETKRLGDIAEIVMGQSPSSSNYNSIGKGLPLIQGNADILNRWAIKRIYTTQSTKRGKAGDVLMSVRAPVGEISRTTFDVCLGRGVCAIRFPNAFLYHSLVFFEPNWTKHSKGSTFDSVNSSDVNAVEIYIPVEEEEQVAIATIFSDMDAELAALDARLTKTRALKQAMMQELLTGKTRLV